MIALLAACSGPAGDGGDGALAPTADTGVPWDGFVPHAFGPVAITFAVDAAGNATSFVDAGTGATVPVTATFLFASEDLAEQCTVTFEHPGPIPPAAWAADLGAWGAWELPADALADDDCAAQPFPPAWGGDPAAALRRWTWGFGLGDLEPAVDVLVRQEAGSEYAEVAPFLLGGGYFWDGLLTLGDLPATPVEDWLDGYVDHGLAFAYEVDADLVRREEFGEPVLVEAADVHAGGGVAPAAFELTQTVILSPAELLLAE